MSNSYFRKLPDIEYIDRKSDKSALSDFTRVKNLFKKGKIRDDIFENLVFFDKYIIEGDDRPDIVADKVYGNPFLDWVVLTCNNILNIYDEWPLRNDDFEKYLLGKYGNYNELYNGVHHYESVEVKDSEGRIIFPKGIKVDETQSLSFYDSGVPAQVELANISSPVTNYEYEEKLNNDKRVIFLLKDRYLPVVLDDMEELMKYKEGSTQYVSETLQRADNIRLYT
jgi:hypothetical protein